MSRQQRAEIALQTDQIVRDGTYRTISGVDVSIADAVRNAIQGTTLHLPEHTDNGRPPAGRPTMIEATDESSLTAARRLARARPDPVACPNLASARQPARRHPAR